MLPFIEASRMVAKIASAVFGGVGFFVLWALWRCWPSLDLLPDAALYIAAAFLLIFLERQLPTRHGR
jgi:hypothetical protein